MSAQMVLLDGEREPNCVTFYVMADLLDERILLWQEASDWCRDNLGAFGERWHRGNAHFYIHSRADAALFRLRFV